MVSGMVAGNVVLLAASPCPNRILAPSVAERRVRIPEDRNPEEDGKGK
jgi:hypothetical protein